MPLNSAYSAALISLLAWGNLASGQEPPKLPGTSDLPPGVRWLRDLEYVPGGHERQKLDLYLPEMASGPLPVIVWVHGGGWYEGNKDWRRAVPLVPKGYAVANINYRLSQHAVFPAQLEDCKAAVRWLRANAKKYGLDPDHIGAGGRPRAVTSSRCWARPAASRSWREPAGTSTNPAACSVSSIGSAPRTWPPWADGTTSQTRQWPV